MFQVKMQSIQMRIRTRLNLIGDPSNISYGSIYSEQKLGIGNRSSHISTFRPTCVAKAFS